MNYLAIFGDSNADPISIYFHKEIDSCVICRVLENETSWKTERPKRES